MRKEGEEVHVTGTEASGGSKEGVVRWVLAGGLLLALVLMSIVWIIPALSTGDVEEEGTKPEHPFIVLDFVFEIRLRCTDQARKGILVQSFVYTHAL